MVGARTEVAELVGERQPDLVLVNDDDLTYAKIRLDERSLRTLVDVGIGEFTESLPARAVLVRRLGHDAATPRWPPATTSRLVASGVGSVKRHHRRCRPCCARPARPSQRYADPAWRGPGLALMADALRCLSTGPSPARTPSSPTSAPCPRWRPRPEDLALLAGLLDGSTVLDGLTVDTDLRWALIQSPGHPAASGRGGHRAELARDATATGERSAALTRASIPTAEAKASAWASIIEGKLSGALLRSTILGFMDPRHPDLLEPYAAKYFEEIGSIWKSWTSDSAQNFAMGCYPALSISPETVARTQELIAESQPPHALKRLLLEGADGVSRALRAQAKDAAPA